MTVGCHNQSLTDPKAWLFDLLGVVEGQSAPDWQAKLAATGIPYNPPQHVNPYLFAPTTYGISQQGGGEGPRGRLFLPTMVEDENGYRARPVDVVMGYDEGRPTWGWLDRGGPDYVPAPCDSSEPEPNPNPEPIPDDGVEQILAKLDEMSTDLVTIKVALLAMRTMNGTLTIANLKLPIELHASGSTEANKQA